MLTNDTSVVLEVEEDTVSASPCLALSDDDSWVDCVIGKNAIHQPSAYS